MQGEGGRSSRPRSTNKNPRHMETKTCGKCNQILPIAEFGQKGRWLQSRCRECVRGYAKEYYQRYRIREKQKRDIAYPDKRYPEVPKKVCERHECDSQLGNRSSRFCSSDCYNRHKFDERYAKWLSGEVSWNGLSGHSIKAALLKKRGHQCESCGNIEWQGKPIPLQMDHTDGNSLDHSPGNVRLLCPNCHAMTPTYGARNIGNGREARRLKLQQKRLNNLGVAQG